LNVNPVDHAREISTLTALAKTDRVLGSAAQNLVPTAELKNAISVSGTDTEDRSDQRRSKTRRDGGELRPRGRQVIHRLA
jgi:hypothetical protein